MKESAPSSCNLALISPESNLSLRTSHDPCNVGSQIQGIHWLNPSIAAAIRTRLNPIGKLNKDRATTQQISTGYKLGSDDHKVRRQI